MYLPSGHAIDTADITISMENSYSRCVNINIRVEVQLFSRLQFYQILNKFINKHFKVLYVLQHPLQCQMVMFSDLHDQINQY